MINWLKTHKLLLGILILGALAIWFFFGRKPKVSYDEFSVKRQDISETLELSGKVRAENTASLKFLAGGLLTYVGAKEGDTVKKWQTLASVDTRQLQKAMEQKLNLYAIQRGSFEQTVDDNNNAVPNGDLGRTLERLLSKNQYQLENTVKDVEYQDLYLKLARISSPIAGVLVQSPTSVSGVQVTAVDTWVVVDPDSLYFSADLDETDLKRVSIAQQAHVNLDAFPGREINSLISTISFSPKETSTGTTYEVKIKLTKVDSEDLRLGLNGTVELVMKKVTNALTLPQSSIVSQNGKSTVMIKQGDKYLEKDIQTGIENNGIVEITGGLGEAENVYIKK